MVVTNQENEELPKAKPSLWREFKLLKLTRTVGGTLLYGVIINFIWLGIIDAKRCTDSSCESYTALLFLSLVLGFIVSLILNKIDPPKLEDLE